MIGYSTLQRHLDRDRLLRAGVRGGAIDGGVGNYNENAGAVYNARELRRQFDRFKGWDVRTGGGSATTGTANGGVARHLGSATTGDLAVIQRAAGANMSVDVLLGGALVGGTESAHQGDYFVYSDASINVAITAADATNPRIDLIVVRVTDSEYSGGTNTATVEVVTGTAAGVPAEPTIPANCLTLARVDVAALAASIVTANITDRRRNLSQLGGITPCTSSSTYPTVNLWEGMAVYDRTLDAVLFYSGAAWIQIGPLSGWTAFTPALTNITIGNGVLGCAYMRVGRSVSYRISLIWGTTTSASGTQTFALPVAAHAIYVANSNIGVATAVGGGTGAGGAAIVITAATTVAVLINAGFVNATVPGVFANGDGVWISGTYEAAA